MYSISIAFGVISISFGVISQDYGDLAKQAVEKQKKQQKERGR